MTTQQESFDIPTLRLQLFALTEQRAELLKQRDELLAALQDIGRLTLYGQQPEDAGANPSGWEPIAAHRLKAIGRKVCAAIAKVED